MINDYEYDGERKESFLEKYVYYRGNITLTCKELGISRNTFYKWKKEDADFFTNWEDCVRYLNEKTFFEEIV